MNSAIAQFLPYLLAALVAGAAIGWLLGGLRARRDLGKANDTLLVKFDQAVQQRDKFNAENQKLRGEIEAQKSLVDMHESAVARLRTELRSATERVKVMATQQTAIGAERDELLAKLGQSMNALDLTKRQYAELGDEFARTGVFFKGELQKSLEKRKTLESKVEDAQAEQGSLATQLDAARTENVSVNRMLAAAQARLEHLDAMESRINALESENAQLRHEAAKTRQTVEALERDVGELDELKVRNSELAHCLKSMEDSRKQYERDAERYRDRAAKSERRSETLRTRLDDVEKNFAQLAKQQDNSARLVEVSTDAPPAAAEAAANDEIDDLTEIVGIGKMFEETLHRLGIRSFRQIASLGPVDIARINMELREFQGRLEQDDWIGQARSLLHKKYGNTH